MMSRVVARHAPDPEPMGSDDVLERIAAGAADRDAAPGEGRFPQEAFVALRDAGCLRFNAVPGHARPAAALELGLVRRVAAADGSVGRIFDGHLNAVERIAVQAPAELRDRELRRVSAGELWAGVWGGDPVPGEGPPATIVTAKGADVLRGVKTFCSGAGGLHRALVLARDDADPTGPPTSVWIDLTDSDRVEIDTSWYRSRGLVASVSHRVVFHDAPVLARLGAPGAIAEQPWFGRDALRTSASWAGMADTAVCGALGTIAQRPGRGDLEGLAAGRILTAQRTIDVWLQAAAPAMDRPDADLAAVALHGRVAIADACRTLLDEAARACGSRPFARGDSLDRARRDLEVFLLQHRLDPMLVRAGAAALVHARS
jgi:alkylation response protein AidB-like acyl-CoA dehydrogenase